MYIIYIVEICVYGVVIVVMALIVFLLNEIDEHVVFKRKLLLLEDMAFFHIIKLKIRQTNRMCHMLF